MRDYLSPAKRFVSQAITRVPMAKSLSSRQGILVALGAASVLAVALVTFVVVRTNASQASVKTTITSSQTATPDKDEAVFSAAEKTDDITTQENQPMTTQSSSNSDSTSNVDTKITVNNQDIPVPENGTVHRTIQSDNGTTNVTVNTSTGTTSNQSTTSTSTNVNTSTFSHSTNMNISSQ